MSPALFFLRIDLAIWGLLKFHMNLRITFSISVKNANGRDRTESTDGFV